MLRREHLRPLASLVLTHLKMLRSRLHGLLAGALALLSMQSIDTRASVHSDTLTLSKGWTFHEAGKSEVYPASVPGVVQQDLIRLGKLPDPYFRLAEDSIQWVGERDWTYQCTFSLTTEQLQRPSIHLLFEGLDTYASVYLNGTRILEAENMFVGHEVDVRRWVKASNTLEVRFSSPLQAALPLYDAAGGINYPADNDHAEKHLSVFTRKAPYHYGWDWGERMITIGIWRPVRLLLRGATHFAERPVITYHPERRLPIEVRLPEGAVTGTEATHLSYSLYDADGKKVFSRVAPLADFVKPTAQGGLHALPKLQLWWPNGLGKPYRYEARFELRRGARGRVLDETRFHVGFRTIELVREEDKDGRSFFFKVNGLPFFAKGANYIPGTLLLPTRTDGDRKQLFEDITRSHFNMLRVWGGGTYEEGAFYDEADARGILIWQDFMFACTAYPGDEAFLRNVEHELRYNIRRLRQHPSIATWCGNNEIREGLKYWGWAKRYPAEVYQRFWRDYEALFCKLIPETLREEDPLRSYIESSPDTVNWGRPKELGLGESHYWGVWYGREPFEILRERMPRFMSEFGVQSFPMLSSIRRFALPEDYDLESAVMKGHQKSSIGNDVILHYIRQDYPEPRDFEDFVYLSQVMQGRGIALGIRAQRAAAPYCMGSLYWQLNDAWPAVSWSSIDYYGVWKGLQYEAKRAFEPVILVPDTAQRVIRIAHDPLPKDRQVRLSAEVRTFSGAILRIHVFPEQTITRGAVGSIALPLPMEQLIQSPEEARSSYILYELRDKKTGALISQYTDYAVKTKELELPDLRASGDKPTISMGWVGDTLQITLESRLLLKDVYLDLEEEGWHLSENFFDVLPGETYVVKATRRNPSSSKRIPKLYLRAINYHP